MRDHALFFVLALCLSSCSLLLGIKKPKPVTEQQVADLSEKWGLSHADVYFLDTAYKSFVATATGNNKKKINDYLQPLQAIYFGKGNSNQYPLSWHINCYVPGFPNPNWNYDGKMNQFPPLTAAPVDSNFSLKKIVEYLRPVKGAVPFNTVEYDYIILVYWNRFMEKQSKGLIEAVQRNLKLAVLQKAKVLYINNDNLFSE